MSDVPARLDPVTCELWLPRGPDLPCEVLRLTGREALSQPFSFEIEIWCDDADAPLGAVLGADVELLLERGGLERRVFGLVAEVDVRLSIAGRSERDGVGARLLARPDATTVGIAGPGVMARTTLAAFMTTCPNIDTVKVKGRGRASMEKFIAWFWCNREQHIA